MRKIIHRRLIHVLILLIFCSGALIFSSAPASSETSGLTEPTDTQKTTDISQRLLKRKAELQLKIAEEQKKRVAERCGAAQTKIGLLKSKDTQIREKRFQRYNGIMKQVSTMIGRLSQQGLSTAELQNALNLYVNAVNQYLADAEEHKTAIADLVSMACDKDAEGFSATLQTARSARQQLLKDGVEIRSAVTQIKAALATAKDSLPDTGGGTN